MLARHGRDHNDCDESTHEYEEETRMLQVRYGTVTEDHKNCDEPDDADKSNIRMPRFDYEIWVEDSVPAKECLSSAPHLKEGDCIRGASAHICTRILAGMVAIEARSNIQPKKLRLWTEH